MKSGSIYYASDKALFDALNQHKVTISDLRDLFFSRGIIISKDSVRKDLAVIFSRLIHDYYDHQKLAKILGSSSRRERNTSIKINSPLESSKIEDAAHQIKNEVSQYGDHVEVSQTENIIKVKINYKETNYNKSEFRQVVQKESIIIFEKNADKWSVRNPLNDHIEEIKSKIIDRIEQSSEEPLDIEEISLEHLSSNEKRTKFFIDLIKNVEGFQLTDVTDVFVFHPKSPVSEDDDDQDGSSNGVHITKASLKGEGVLQSDELRSLYDKGFYICKIVWQGVNSSVDSDLYEFEAQFANPEDCKKFSYLLKGFYKYKCVGEYNKNRTLSSTAEENQFNKLIENAAQVSLHNLINIEKGEVTNDNAENKVV
jgi:hypothetical protein